jgi:hypothetical protein
MAKKINLDEIDESFIIASVKKDRTAAQETIPPPLTPLPATAAATTEPEPENRETEAPPEPPKAENRKGESRGKRSEEPEYETLFIRESDLPPARFGKSVYIRKEYHDRISQIISVIGGNDVSLFGYIDNVLSHHFENFQDDIVRSFRKKTIFK